MTDNFLTGLLIGAIIGGLIIYMNPKAQQMLDKGKEELKEKVEQL